MRLQFIKIGKDGIYAKIQIEFSQSQLFFEHFNSIRCALTKCHRGTSCELL